MLCDRLLCAGKLGLCLQQTRNHSQALEHLLPSLQLSQQPLLFERLRSVGECYEALGVYRGAVEYLQKALQQCEAGEVTLTSAVTVSCCVRLCHAVAILH